MYAVHTAFCVSIWYGSELRMRVVHTFEYRQHAASVGIIIRTHECFGGSKWHKRYSFPSDAPVSVLWRPAEYWFQILPLCTVRSATIARQTADSSVNRGGGGAGRRSIAVLHAFILIQARMHANSDTEAWHACESYTRMKSVLLIWMSSLNDRSKLKGQYKDVKSGCGLSVGPSLLPHSLSLKTFLVTLSL